jgi:hypothetical protein
MKLGRFVTIQIDQMKLRKRRLYEQRIQRTTFHVLLCCFGHVTPGTRERININVLSYCGLFVHYCGINLCVLPNDVELYLGPVSDFIKFQFGHAYLLLRA